MELWGKVIVEWINCLEVQEKPVKNITELQDGVFYINFLKLIKWKKLENFNQEDIMNFIGEEYPTFKVNKDDDAEHIFIASLLLLHLCRTLFAIHHSLQYNMCDNLRNETQIRVKAFLESVLPIGKEITKETMREVIMEVEDTSTVLDNRRTPPVEDFSNSPLTRSGRSKKILTERVRELRDLKCSLAIERFTNADLRDDILRQHNKIKKLQKKLDEKSTKIKELREERIKPNTPQPSHTKENNSQEDYYKRYINDLENQLSKQQDEINKLETEKDVISKELCCTRRTSKHYKENFANLERSLESISNKIELKDRELIELRMHNEELRAHIKELNRNSNPEQSFEVEDASLIVAKSFNTSEALSSVIEIQLQEAREESAILHAQIDSLKGKLDILTKDYRKVMESNRDLEEKIKTLDRMQAELNHIQKELDISNTVVAGLKMEKVSLFTETENLKSLLSVKEERLTEIKQSNVVALDNVNKLTANLKNRELLLKYVIIQLEDLQSINRDLKLIKEETQQNFGEYQKNIKLTFEKLQHEYQTLDHNYHKVQQEKKKIEYNFNCNKEELSKIQTINITLQQNLLENKEKIDALEEKERILFDELNESKRHVQELRDTNRAMEEQYAMMKTETSDKLESLESANTTLQQNLLENKEKIDALEKNKRILLDELNESKRNVQELRNTNRTLEEQYAMMKTETSDKLERLESDNTTLQQNLLENEEKISALEEKKRMLFDELNEFKHHVQELKDTNRALEEQYAMMKTETSDKLESLESNNTTLQQNLLENEEKISALEEKKRILLDELNESKRHVQELKDINRALEKQHAMLKTETNDKLESLESDNTTLQQNLLENEEKIDALEKNKRILLDELNESKRNVEELRDTNRTLEEQYAMMKTETSDKLERLESDNTTLQQNLLENEEKIDALEKNKRILLDELNEFKRRVQELKDTNRALEEQYTMMKTETNDKLESLELDNTALQQNLFENEEKISALEEKKRILLDELNESKRHVQELKDINRALEKQHAMLKTETNDKLESLESDNTTLQQNLLENKEKIDALEKNKRILLDELNESKRNVQELRNTNRTLEEQYAMMKTETSDKLERLESDNTTLQQNLLENEEKISALEEKKRMLFDELNEFKRHVQELKDTNRALEEQYAMMKTETSDKLERLESDNITLQQNLLENEEKIDALEKNKRILLDELNESKRNVEELRDTNRTLEEQYAMMKTETSDKLERLESDNTTLQQNLLENEEKIDALEKNKRILLDELNEFKRRVQELKDTNRALEEQYTMMKTETNDKLESLELDNTALQQNLFENEEKISALEEKKRILLDELNESKRHVQELKDINRALEKQHAMLKTETNDKLESLESDNTTLQQNLLENKEKIDALEKNKRILLDELNESKRNVQELRNTNRTLEEQYAMMKTETSDKLERLESDNTTLQQNLLENEEKISALEEKKRMLFDELNEFKRHVQELKDTNRALEEQYAMMKTETSDKLERLESDNITLQQNLLENEEKIDALEKNKRILLDELNESKRNVEELRDTNRTLEEQYAMMKTETSDKLERLESDNTTLQQNLLENEEKIDALEKNKRILLDELNEFKRRVQELKDTNRALEEQYTMMKTETNDKLESLELDNTALQQNLFENEEKIGDLEEKKRILFDELNEFKRYVQELKDTNRALKEQYAMMKTETNDKLESLESNNAKILLELKDATDKLNLLRQEETRKIEAKDKEIEIKENALLTLQTKMDKLVSEANITEKKMKEIIINLQEIRTSQDAVLATQEAALKEKCLYIEELQKRFDISKEILNKELEDTQSSLRKCQTQFFDLENQLNNQNKTIAELQDMLKTMSAELETNKEYCKHMNASQVEIVKLCQELEHPTKNLNSTITETCSDFDLHDIPQCINIENKYKSISIDNNVNILNIIKMTLHELHKSQKIISHLSCANFELNETLTKQKTLIENSEKDKDEICSLNNKIRELKIIAQKRNDYLKGLIKNKESLKDFLQKVFATRNDLDTILTSSKQKWNEILTKFQDIFYNQNSVCDEFKQLQIKKTNLENILLKCQIDYSENIKSICDILWEKFLWTEQKLHDTYLCSIHEKECLDILTSVEEDQFPNEKMIIDIEFEKYKALQIDVIKSVEEIETFTTLATFYDNSLKTGEIKNQVEIEKKLQNQINQLTKEKKDLKTRMDTMRLRNVKLEKNIDDLRTEMKRLKSTETIVTEANSTMSEGTEMQSLKEELERLREQNQQLHEEMDESNKVAKQKSENQLKEIHAAYEQKLEDMKQKMKTAYNEQITKLNKDQEKILQEKLQNQMEVMCQRQREELNRYKAHVGDLSSQLWNVGEKLLIEQQQKQDTLQRLKDLETKVKEFQVDQPMATISRKTCRMEKQEMLPENAQAHKVTTLITEETLERRHSIRSIQAMGNVFKTEDEEEIFDNVYLADMKRGNFMPITDNRLSVLQMRNSLCKPHLKSSYPAEMQFLPSTLTEEEIKTGSSAEDNFNDSLSQSLLPEQKARKKDRSQISYKKPGPPTPSKNGGRLSLQGNELKSPSSRVLRERNVDRRTTTTPHSLKNIFSLKRQDENTTSTPKGRRLSSLFRRSRLQSDR